jgi:hypothetical protein
MFLSQSSAQQAATCPSRTDTGTKRIVTSKGFAVDVDPPRSQPAAKLLLLKENPTEENIASYCPASMACLSLLAGYLRRVTHIPVPSESPPTRKLPQNGCNVRVGDKPLGTQKGASFPLDECIGLKSSVELAAHYSVRSAINGSTLAARPAGPALAPNATPATPMNASR